MSPTSTVPTRCMSHSSIRPIPPRRSISIDASAALALPGVRHVLTGADLAAAVDPMMNGLDTPNVQRYSLAVGQARYAGEWVAAVVADTRALAEDGAELVEVVYEPLPFVIDAEEAYAPDSPPVHAGHGSNVLLDRTFVWGEVDRHFAESPHHLRFRVTWGRNSTVPIETFGVLASWDPVGRDARRMGLDPDAQVCRPDRPRHAPAGQCRARALRRGRRRQLWRQARHQAHGARRASCRAF